MLQQILKDMYIDPDVLEALNEEQKKTLFLKMRQEQVRRWTEREEKVEREGSTALKPKQTKATMKSVRWLLGRDGDVLVHIIGEADEVRSAKFIYSELGQTKGSGPACSNARNQSNAIKSSLVTRAQLEPETVPSQTSLGIQLQFKGIQPASDLTQQPSHSQSSEGLKSHLPLLQDPEKDDNSSVSLLESVLFYRSHLKGDHAVSISDRLRPLSTRRADPPSSADRLRLQEALQPDKGDIQPVGGKQREETEGTEPKGAGSAGSGDHSPGPGPGGTAHEDIRCSHPQAEHPVPPQTKTAPPKQARPPTAHLPHPQIISRASGENLERPLPPTLQPPPRAK